MTFTHLSRGDRVTVYLECSCYFNTSDTNSTLASKLLYVNKEFNNF